MGYMSNLHQLAEESVENLAADQGVTKDSMRSAFLEGFNAGMDPDNSASLAAFKAAAELIARPNDAPKLPPGARKLIVARAKQALDIMGHPKTGMWTALGPLKD